MNISKNLLSLGLIAVISGISTAQTYTATAGTNGITDIQSDYSMSTGDGASVSVDVPLEFELPKKVALSVVPNGGELSTNPMFSAIKQIAADRSLVYMNDYQWTLGSGIERTNFNGMNILSLPGAYANTFVGVHSAIYSNTDNVSVEITTGPAVHDLGSSAGELSTYCHWHAYTNTWEAALSCDQVSYTTLSKSPKIMNFSTLPAENENGIITRAWVGIDHDTLTPTDRSGKYTATQTITVSVL